MSSLEAVTDALIADLASMEAGQCVRLVAHLNGMVVGNATLFREQHSLKQHIGSIHDVVWYGLGCRSWVLLTVLPAALALWQPPITRPPPDLEQDSTHERGVQEH